MRFDIVISGVGGQGQVLASRLLGAAAIASGFSARTGETIGMAQRGGSVISSVRIGDGVFSPTVPNGKADMIIGFEICEALRALSKLKSGGIIILNDVVVKPITVSLGLQEYDRNRMIEVLNKTAARFVLLDAGKLAEESGTIKSTNVVMLGAAVGCGILPFSYEEFRGTIKELIPSKYLESNLKAFEKGYLSAMEVLS